MRLVRRVAALAAVIAFVSPALADGPAAAISANTISISSQAGISNGRITILGPDGTYVEKDARLGSTSISVGGLSGLPDGTYSYQITGSTGVVAKNSPTDQMNNGRGPNARKLLPESISSSGFFTVSNGHIVQPDSEN